MVGVSTACLYPLETEKSLELLVKNGVKGVEIFINAESEIEEGFLSYLRDLCLGYGVRIISLHPHTTFAESFYFFNKYERRQNDSFELYRRLFAKTAYLGAEVFNFHGANSYYNVEPDEYAETLGKLLLQSILKLIIHSLTDGIQLLLVGSLQLIHPLIHGAAKGLHLPLLTQGILTILLCQLIEAVFQRLDQQILPAGKSRLVPDQLIQLGLQGGDLLLAAVILPYPGEDQTAKHCHQYQQPT